MKKIILTVTFALLSAACAPRGFQALDGIASEAVQDIACKDANLETKLWDGLKTYLLEQKDLPEAQDLNEAFKEQLSKISEDLSSQEQELLLTKWQNLINTLLSEAPTGERVETSDQLLILLSAIDVGDRTTVFRSYMQDKVRSQFKELNHVIETLNTSCEPASPPPTGEPSTPSLPPAPPEDETQEPVPASPPSSAVDYNYHRDQALNAGVALAAFGQRWTFATAYQSCQALQLPSLTQQSNDVAGIKITGKHSDGVGSKREIASLSEVQRTHTYVRDMNSYGEGCFNVKANPLIYDYGGKPYATTSANSPIDLFKDNGNGTKVLGIDCSGFVFSSMAAAGLKLKSGRALKASDSWAWGSSAYVEPQKNGLTCLEKIPVTRESSIKAGDIVAVVGHVLMIDKTGSDPFGVSKITKQGDCAKISSDNFDFVIAQSSNSKNGIGINYFEARDYLKTSSKMKEGLEKYAVATCVAKFTGKGTTPQLGTLSVVRHKGSADCVAPRVKLAREACIQSCSSLLR